MKQDLKKYGEGKIVSSKTFVEFLGDNNINTLSCTKSINIMC
jgi:hypothetical protein